MEHSGAQPSMILRTGPGGETKKKKSKKITVISHGQKRVPNGRVLRAGTVDEMIAAMEIQTSSKRYRRKINALETGCQKNKVCRFPFDASLVAWQQTRCASHLVPCPSSPLAVLQRRRRNYSQAHTIHPCYPPSHASTTT